MRSCAGACACYNMSMWACVCLFGSASGDEGLTSSIHSSQLQLSACVQVCVCVCLCVCGENSQAFPVLSYISLSRSCKKMIINTELCNRLQFTFSTVLWGHTHLHAHTLSFLLCLSFSHRPRLLVEVSVRFCSAKHPVTQECLDCSGFSPQREGSWMWNFPSQFSDRRVLASAKNSFLL